MFSDVPSSRELLERAIAGVSGFGADEALYSCEELEQLIPGFEFVRLIGSGGMGAVYEARQINLDRLVAVKILKPSVGLFDEENSLSEEFCDRFKSEAQAMAMLKHPYIVTLYDFGITEQKSIPYLIMELVEGGDLSYPIERGPMEAEKVLVLIQKICNALHYAHARNLVHRDVKPANILLTDEGEPKLTDFGLSKLLTSKGKVADLTKSGTAIGTPEYMAPEQLKGGREVDHRADVFSVGVLLYEMLTSQRLRGSWRPPSEISKGIPAQIDSVVSDSTEPEPEMRIQSTEEIRRRVEGSLRKDRIPMKWLVVSLLTASAISVLTCGLIIKSLRADDSAYLQPPKLDRGQSVANAKDEFEKILKRSKGILTDKFALYFQMAEEDFRENLPPEEIGLRPEIMRIWPDVSGINIAGFWVNGTQDWRVGFQLDESVIGGRHEQMEADGWTLTDFPPGYSGHEFAIWTRDHPRFELTLPGIRSVEKGPWAVGVFRSLPHQRGCADFQSSVIYSLYGKPRIEYKDQGRFVSVVSISKVKNEIERLTRTRPNAVVRSVEWARSSNDRVWIHMSVLPSPITVERIFICDTDLNQLLEESRSLADEGWVPFDLSTGGREQEGIYFLMVWERVIPSDEANPSN